MRWHDLPAALLAFAALVAVLPAWAHFAGAFSPGSGAHAFIGGLVLPGVVLLYVASWVSPSVARAAAGGLVVLMGGLLLAPSWWRLTDMAVSLQGLSPFAETLLRLALSVVVLAAVGTLGYARYREAAGQ